MLRRVYAASKWYCAVTALAIAWSFFHIVWLYRFFLFKLTLSVVWPRIAELVVGFDCSGIVSEARRS
jgi:hypothetical protein